MAGNTSSAHKKGDIHLSISTNLAKESEGFDSERFRCTDGNIRINSEAREFELAHAKEMILNRIIVERGSSAIRVSWMVRPEKIRENERDALFVYPMGVMIALSSISITVSRKIDPFLFPLADEAVDFNSLAIPWFGAGDDSCVLHVTFPNVKKLCEYDSEVIFESVVEKVSELIYSVVNQSE